VIRLGTEVPLSCCTDSSSGPTVQVMQGPASRGKSLSRQLDHQAQVMQGPASRGKSLSRQLDRQATRIIAFSHKLFSNGCTLTHEHNPRHKCVGHR
jgi:hypothetical protein